MTPEAALRRSLIAIPSVNGAHLLRRMLPTLGVPGHLVVVIDQASEDDTAQVCEEAGVNVHQAGKRLTYTQACDLGAALAKERGCEFLFVGNNDIAFTTDVCRELLTEMLHDERLGIVAPARVIVDERSGERLFAYRAHWQLESLNFHHDFTAPPFNARRLEADFCELAFVLVRLSAIQAVGFLDDEYGLYHADADFCFRLGLAGFSSAYLPHSQIEHYAGPTFAPPSSSLEFAHLRKSRQLFAARHLGYGVDHSPDHALMPARLQGPDRTLNAYLRRYGLIDNRRPKLRIGHAVGAGLDGVEQASPGVETDIFNPWGPVERFAPERTIAWFDPPAGEPFTAVAQAVRAAGGGAKLILIGSGISSAVPAPGAATWRRREATFRESADGRLLAIDLVEAIGDEERARILRSVDFTLWTAPHPAAALGAAESLACGTPVIIPRHAAFADVFLEGGISFSGGTCDGSGTLQPDALADAIAQAVTLDPQACLRLSEQGVLRVRQRLTWRHAIYRLRRSLGEVQDPLPTIEQIGAREDPDASVGPAPRLMANWSRNQLRRVSAFITLFADDWDQLGGRYAASALKGRLTEFGTRRASGLFGRARKVSRSARTRLSAPSTAEPAGAKPGVLFLGYVEAGLGLGESLRGLVTAYSGGSQPFAIYPFNEGVETRWIGPFMPERYDCANRYDVVVMEVAADQVPKVEETVQQDILTGPRKVLRTYWELPAAPAAWQPMLRGIDEIWAPNNFVAKAFRDIFDGDIVVIPPCIEPSTDAPPARAHYGLENGRFYFLFTFDYFSFPARKNPQGVLAAFKEAFPDPSEAVGLVLKSTGATGHHPELKRAFLAASKADTRIRILDKNMSRSDAHGLIQACDCYVSLHRSEGFGFGMAEAMFYEKPVVATRYSGNTDFLTDETGFPVDFHLRAVGEDEYVWPHQQVWAEPNIRSAVDAFRTVYERPDIRRQRAEAGAAFVRRHYGSAAVRAAIEARLEEIKR